MKKKITDYEQFVKVGSYVSCTHKKKSVIVHNILFYSIVKTMNSYVNTIEKGDDQHISTEIKLPSFPFK